MRTIVFAARAALSTGSTKAHSCAVVMLSPDTGTSTGEVAGHVLTFRSLRHFNDRAKQRGPAKQTAENACAAPGGRSNCTRTPTFDTGRSGVRFIDHHDQGAPGKGRFPRA